MHKNDSDITKFFSDRDILPLAPWGEGAHRAGEGLLAGLLIRPLEYQVKGTSLPQFTLHRDLCSHIVGKLLT